MRAKFAWLEKGVLALLIAVMLGALALPRGVHAQDDEECVTIDFNNADLSEGDIPPFGLPGVTFTTNNPVAHPPMIFQSSPADGILTGEDIDLGTPNVAFGGPGRGIGGGPGPGANMNALGNLLIISEDADPNDPDDNAGGGTIIMTFTQPRVVQFADLVDVEEPTDEGINAVKLFDSGDNLIVTVPMATLGDNSFQRLFFGPPDVGIAGVKRVEVVFPGSGALSLIAFCEPDQTAVQLSGASAVDLARQTLWLSAAAILGVITLAAVATTRRQRLFGPPG